mmetsp:Transcript_39270/g.65172  ORF Transcript_39270/g.65172 Transcript_39270/m.65172 type:complete len:129 (+) Transcript_39270:29-415(+)
MAGSSSSSVAGSISGSSGAVIRLKHPHVYSCASCQTHVATHDQLISKSFQGRHGRAFLFKTAVNVSLGPREDRVLMTGLHTVSDIFCSCTSCGSRLGWKYVEAFEPSQKYKEGKFIVEKAKVVEGTPL